MGKAALTLLGKIEPLISQEASFKQTIMQAKSWPHKYLHEPLEIAPLIVNLYAPIHCRNNPNFVA